MSNRKAKAARREGRQIRAAAQQQTVWNPRLKAIVVRVVAFAIVLAVFGLGASAFWKYWYPIKPLHPFSAAERSAFTAALKSGGVPSKSVWLSCPEGKPEICQRVQQFIAMFQQSGWKVERNQVIQWKPAHPLNGVYLVLRASGGPGDTTPAESAGVKSAFAAINIPVQTAGAPDVPKDSIGVFFGPDL
jgi:hypothetical protein